MRTIFSNGPLSETARVTYLVLVLGAAAGITVLFILFQQQRNQLHQQVRALQVVAAEVAKVDCLRKHDQQHAVVRAEAFLRDHPHGTPDFPLAFILKTIAQDKEVLKALQGVHCPPLTSR